MYPLIELVSLLLTFILLILFNSFHLLQGHGCLTDKQLLLLQFCSKNLSSYLIE